MHTKDKSRCGNFIAQLKGEPDIVPFLVKFENNLGYYGDYDFIALRKDIDISTIEKKLRANKYHTVKEFYKELKVHFENYAVFCFEGDEINVLAKRFMKMVAEHERSHIPVSEVEASVHQHHTPTSTGPKNVKSSDPKPAPIQCF
mgnify:FL=1|jgi:hypothetical protein